MIRTTLLIMNTPAHLLINLALGSKLTNRREAHGAIVMGALLPDVPMYFFYLWERYRLATPEKIIWSERYFDPAWQNIFDLFNAFPLIFVFALFAFLLRWNSGLWLAASMFLHGAIDLAMHHDDGHRHFFPMSDWRFASPVSYWDPQHHGMIGSSVEMIAALLAAAVLWRQPIARAFRLLVGVNVVLEVLLGVLLLWLVTR